MVRKRVLGASFGQSRICCGSLLATGGVLVCILSARLAACSDGGSRVSSRVGFSRVGQCVCDFFAHGHGGNDPGEHVVYFCERWGSGQLLPCGTGIFCGGCCLCHFASSLERPSASCGGVTAVKRAGGCAAVMGLSLSTS